MGGVDPVGRSSVLRRGVLCCGVAERGLLALGAFGQPFRIERPLIGATFLLLAVVSCAAGALGKALHGEVLTACAPHSRGLVSLMALLEPLLFILSLSLLCHFPREGMKNTTKSHQTH